MRKFGRRAWFLSGLGVLSVPLVAAAVAYGCTAAAILSVNPNTATAGSTVTVTGKYFNTHTNEPTSASRVQIRFGSVTGPVLAEATPSGQDRAFSVQIRVPDSASGNSFISATQFLPNGTPVYGTPARQAFKVLAAPAATGGGAQAGGQTVNQVVTRQVRTLSLATARRLAGARVKRSNRSAKSIRTKCARRSRTTAVCRVTYRLKSKTRTKRLVVSAPSSSASW